MKKQNNAENYLNRIPVQNEGIDWQCDEQGIVTLFIENKGVYNRIAQKLFKKPKISQIHLDKIGSCVWQLIDGNSDIAKIGESAKKQLGDELNPLYERLVKYVQILESYKFVSFK